MDRWEGKVAVVTGASVGIGAAITVALANNGVHVVGLARRPELVEALRDSVKGAGQIVGIKADVSKEEDIEAAFNIVRSKFGTVNILVNNAGILRPGQLMDQDPKFMREVLDVNVMGLSICTQQAIKLMKESGVDDGHIIHINSVAGHSVPSTPGQPIILAMYSASKYAVTALTETLRKELVVAKSNIKITSISPGYVKTDIISASFNAVGTELPSDVKGAINEQAGLESEDIAQAVIYVLSTKPHVQIHELTIKPIGEAI